MPAPIALHLSPAQTQELTQVRAHDPTPYLREKAAAILKVAAGQSLRAVGRGGLLRPRRRETIATWVRRYLADGIPGVRVRPGRGRKPAFFPSAGSGGDRSAAPAAAARTRPKWPAP